MNRRTMLKGTLASTIVASLPQGQLFADGKPGPGTGSRPFHQFTLGNLDLLIVSDGSLSLGPIPAIFAPDVPSEEVNQLLENAFRPVDAVELGINILVIKKGKQVILVDAGAGSGFGVGSGWLTTSLSGAGINPEAVTDIILTHAHTDHIGGLVNSKESLSFPQANIYLSKVEHSFWTATCQDFDKCRFSDKKVLTDMAKEIKKTLTLIAPKLKLYDNKDQLFNCIKLEAAPGHTPGHTLVTIYSGQDEIIHIADLVHADILTFQRIEWGFTGDTDFEASILMRKKILGELALSGKKTIGYHLPWPGIGHVKKNGVNYMWIPEVYPFPG